MTNNEYKAWVEQHEKEIEESIKENEKHHHGELLSIEEDGSVTYWIN